MMRIKDGSFGLGEVSTATAASAETIKAWLRRGYVVNSDGISGGRDVGTRRRFDFHSIMEMAAASAFLRLGIEGRRAFDAVQPFAHLSDGVGGWIDAGEQPKTLRLPGLPFPGDENTLLVLTARGAKVIRASELVAVEDSAFINLSALFDRVVTALGGDPTEELRRAYPQENDAR